MVAGRAEWRKGTGALTAHCPDHLEACLGHPNEPLLSPNLAGVLTALYSWDSIGQGHSCVGWWGVGWGVGWSGGWGGGEEAGA